MEEFQSSFVPPRKFNFSRKRIDNLKTKAAEFLVNKFETIHSHPGQATQQPRKHRQRKDLTKWLLPNLFGDEFCHLDFPQWKGHLTQTGKLVLLLIYTIKLLD